MRRLLEPGEYSDPSEVLEIARIDVLRVEASVPASLFGRVDSEGPAEVLLDLEGEAPLEASVAVLDPVVDPASGTFGMRVEVPNPEHALPAGVRCQLRLPLTLPDTE